MFDSRDNTFDNILYISRLVGSLIIKLIIKHT